MEFGFQKCGLLIMKRGKPVKSQGIKLGEEVVVNVGEEGYKYLGILEWDKIQESKMKEIFRKEYLRRTSPVLQPKLNGRNKINAINTWAVSLLRYGAGKLSWRKDEITEIDRRTRKLMTMNKAFNQKSDVSWLYAKRKQGGRGLIGIEMCVKGEENNLAWYIKNTGEMLQMVKIHGHLNTEECKDPKVFWKEGKEITMREWKEKNLHGQYLNENEAVDWDKTWGWLSKGNLKCATEALIYSAQEQSLRTNYLKYHIERAVESPL